MLSVNFQADSNSFINSSPFTALNWLFPSLLPISLHLNSQQTSGLILALSWLQRQRKVWYVGKGMLVETEHRTVGSCSCPQPAPHADWICILRWHLFLVVFPSRSESNSRTGLHILSSLVKEQHAILPFYTQTANMGSLPVISPHGG